MHRSWKFVAAWAALFVALAIPASVLAAPAVPAAVPPAARAPAPVAAPAPVGAAPTLTLTAQAGTFAGKWVYRSFGVSADPKATLAKLALGLNEMTLTEQGGHVGGTRTGAGVTYNLAGTALYAPKQGATLRLHGTATIGGKSYNYDYFGYLLPSWTVGGKQVDTIVGTVLRTDPANSANAPLVASFVATRE